MGDRWHEKRIDLAITGLASHKDQLASFSVLAVFLSVLSSVLALVRRHMPLTVLLSRFTSVSWVSLGMLVPVKSALVARSVERGSSSMLLLLPVTLTRSSVPL